MVENLWTSWNLPKRRLGRTIRVYPLLESTNTLALSLAAEIAHDGLAILAHEQSAGRGQQGRVWTAPPGSSVLLSVLLFPPPELRRPAVLTAWAAVAVAQTIQNTTGLHATIKWPNDVLIQGKKVCGILIEQRNSGRPEAPLATVVGIGLNVRQPAEYFAQAQLPLAASLASLSGQTPDTRTVAEVLLQRLDEDYHRLLAGDTTTLEVAWQKHLGIVGNPVVVETAQDSRTGRLIDVTLEAVVLETPDGAMERIAPELVRHLTARPRSAPRTARVS